jgi:hypothetical protein
VGGVVAAYTLLRRPVTQRRRGERPMVEQIMVVVKMPTLGCDSEMIWVMAPTMRMRQARR